MKATLLYPPTIIYLGLHSYIYIYIYSIHNGLVTYNNQQNNIQIIINYGKKVNEITPLVRKNNRMYKLIFPHHNIYKGTRHTSVLLSGAIKHRHYTALFSYSEEDEGLSARNRQTMKVNNVTSRGWCYSFIYIKKTEYKNRKFKFHPKPF